jgi:hypothetical protein
MRQFVLLAVVVSLAAVHAAEHDDTEPDAYFPQQLTARELLKACASSSLTRTGRERQRYCHGFVSGVEEGLRLAQDRGFSDGAVALCVPAGRTAREFARAYMRFAAGQGVDLEMAAARVVVLALQDAYPCATSAPGARP